MSIQLELPLLVGNNFMRHYHAHFYHISAILIQDMITHQHFHNNYRCESHGNMRFISDFMLLC